MAKGREAKQQQQLRRGKWSAQELSYAEALILGFRGGIADCEQGTTLRNFLCQKLQCGPMRISKRLAGRGPGKHQLSVRFPPKHAECIPVKSAYCEDLRKKCKAFEELTAIQRVASMAGAARHFDPRHSTLQVHGYGLGQRAPPRAGEASESWLCQTMGGPFVSHASPQPHQVEEMQPVRVSQPDVQGNHNSFEWSQILEDLLMSPLPSLVYGDPPPHSVGLMQQHSARVSTQVPLFEQGIMETRLQQQQVFQHLATNSNSQYWVEEGDRRR